jgi:hypothetical protein
MGFSLPLLGRLIDLVIAAVVPLREIRRHMREEQANLIPLLAPPGESAASQARLSSSSRSPYARG